MKEVMIFVSCLLDCVSRIAFHEDREVLQKNLNMVNHTYDGVVKYLTHNKLMSELFGKRYYPVFVGEVITYTLPIHIALLEEESNDEDTYTMVVYNFVRGVPLEDIKSLKTLTDLRERLLHFIL